MLFCGPLGMHVILRPAGNACYFAAAWSAKFILLPLGVQNLFCCRLECKIYFAAAWNACYFAAAFRSKFILLSAKIDNDPFFGNAPYQKGLNPFGVDGVVGNKNTLPAPYIDGVVGNKNPLPTLH